MTGAHRTKSNKPRPEAHDPWSAAARAIEAAAESMHSYQEQAEAALLAVQPFIEAEIRKARREAAEKAWNEGYDAGHPAAHAANPEWPRAPRNPYRKEDS